MRAAEIVIQLTSQVLSEYRTSTENSIQSTLQPEPLPFDPVTKVKNRDGDSRLSYGGDILAETLYEVGKHYESLEDAPIVRAGDKRGYFKQPNDYCVYVLKCEPVDDSAHGTAEWLTQRWESLMRDNSRYDETEVPKFIWRAFYSDHVYYVGQTSDIYKRVEEHAEGFEEGAVLTKIFPPLEIIETRWFSTRSDAKEAEEKVARKYDGGYGNVDIFAYYH